jgi:hypothetical protein
VVTAYQPPSEQFLNSPQDVATVLDVASQLALNQLDLPGSAFVSRLKDGRENEILVVGPQE